jgi:glyoxylase-like metal-dependent hydrolase (beta-lactamase superfamily II)
MKFDWLPVTRYEQNCSILWCENTRRAAIIDPGGDLEQLFNFLELEELELELILVTHGHMDHCGAAAELAEKTGARLEGPHRAEARLLEKLQAQGERFGVKARSYTPDRWLEDGDEVRFGDEVMKVLHCPGHSWGHVTYFHAGERWLFTGDVLFRHAIGAWTFGGDLKTLVTSIRNKLFTLGDDVQFLPGHGDTSSIGHERKANPFVGDDVIEKFWAGKLEPTPPPYY